jgi:ribosomal-protein-alanine N-acetyltransferase
MEAMIDDCKDRNVQSIFLEVRESNAVAIAMYEQFGFIKISTRKKYYDSPVEDGLVMQKQL